MKQNYKMTLQYEGTRYDGWQKQGNTQNTIQGRLEAVLGRLAGEPVEVHGSGRTDAGVHALAQVANFRFPLTEREAAGNPAEGTKRRDAAGEAAAERLSDADLMAQINRYLPEDIAVTALERVPERFHSRFHALEKTYRYQIETGQKRDVFARRMQYGLGRPLNVAAMRSAAAFLCGTHDYRSFCGNKHIKKSTVRTVRSIEIREEGSLVTLSFTGDGFLQNMVRIMVGTLIEVGLGARTPQSMTDILAARDRQAAGGMAPAEGLALVGVLYDEGQQGQ